MKAIWLRSLQHEPLHAFSLVSFTTESMDISELIQDSIDKVSDKTISEALLSFANLSKVKTKQLRKFANDSIAKFSFQSLVGGTHISSDGRVVARTPALNTDDANKDKVIWSQMIFHYGVQLGLSVQGNIMPALNIINQEHRISEYQIYSMVRNSPAIPLDRADIIAKGLYLGFDGDFISALHILVPQLENLVRQHLKQAGKITTTRNIDGIETENGLSTLIQDAEIDKIFGEDLAFEIKALFCDPLGPNIRNNLAHGLLDYEDSQNIYSVYAWWLFFKLVFNQFWISENIKAKENLKQTA